MFAKTTYSGTLAEQYELLSKQLEALCQGNLMPSPIIVMHLLYSTSF